MDGRPIAAGAYAKPLGAAVEVAHARDDEAYRKRLITVFTSITAENAMKWDRIEPEPGRFDFAEADELARFAKRTGKRLRGHPLVYDLQLPSWLTDRHWTAPELRAVLRRHIRTIVSRYRGRVAEWDVVNEPLADDGRFEPNLFHRVLGPGYVPFAFRVAHRADPHARLFLNEIDAERGPKSTALFVLARGLVHQGVPIDALGFQNHTTGRDAVEPRRLRQLFRGARRLGLDAAITEMDVGGTEEGPQARTYREAARACAHAPNCTGLTVWGITDRFSWLTEGAHPLPFDGHGDPKPALDALVRPLRRR